ncbi:hypothetical protein BCON_0011g00220 [Botryotinia convoluta]|uniref:Uncharacterized protein n=1 Tax=Botryotinia convoluta TaxID=54673 RepID=A0A4Z1IVU9_9HELO|nr:hypothetical protein BCON_0011g00220 [Botryotinia convoluta]
MYVERRPIMTDVAHPTLSASSGTQIDAMGQLLESKLVEFQKVIERGIEEIKTEVSSQIETINVGVEGGASRTRSGGAGMLSRFMPGTGYPNLAEEVETLKKKSQKLKEDSRVHKADKAHDAKTIRELRSRLQKTEEDAKEYQDACVQLDKLKIKNRQLQEQMQMLRDMIVNKGGSDVDDLDDNTIIKDFVALREQIQRIVNRYYKCETEPGSPNDWSIPTYFELRRKKFFSMWKDNHSSARFRGRSRAMIFELLAAEILQLPIFGLEEFDRGILENGLRDFEMELEHNLGQVSWRTSTMKCASLLQQSQPSKPSIRPERVATLIRDFMAPLQPHDEIQVNELGEHLYKLCASASKLALTLRRCQDTYKCEIASIGVEIDEETMEPQENEARNRDGGMKVAYVISGCLFKILDVGHARRERMILEKAHVVITD